MNQVIAAYILTHFDTISFDIFDTLIERSVSKPTDIFEIVGEKVLGKEHRWEFLENRIRAEKKAREKSCEITLDQIYQELVDTYKSDIVELLQKTEVQIELENCHKKETIFPFYVFDTYFLHMCGINDYEKLYVSNTYGENKLSGKLFQIACKDCQIDLKSMIHIGDSIKADMIGAHKAGIHVWLVGRKNRIERLIQRI